MDTLNDPARVQAVSEVERLATESREALERLTRLAARLLHSPAALVNLVGADRQLTVARQVPRGWTESSETPLPHSFCKHALGSHEPLVIDDARGDPRTSASSVVTELGVASYLGIPLDDGSGQVVGTLCVVDFAPRRWSSAEVEMLRELAGWVMTEIELRRSTHETAAAERLAEIADRERREKTALLESTGEGIYGIDLEGRCTFINRAAARMLGYEADQCAGLNMHQLIHHRRPDGSPYPEEECPIFLAIRERRSVRLDDELLWRSDGTGFPAEYSAAPVVVDGELNGAVITFVNITERKRNEEAQRFFNGASKVLAASTLDYAATLRSLVRLCVPSLGDWASLLLVRDGSSMERIELAHADPEKQALAEQLRRFPVTPTPDHPAMHVLRSGQGMVFAEVPDELLARVAHDEEHLDVLRRLEMRSGAVVPLIARGRTLGVLMIVSTRPERRYDETDLRMVQEFANRAALAVDNARLFRDSQEANRAKAEFLSTVSHELRTPLNAIVGYTELLREGIPVPIPSESIPYVERIETSSRHLRQLIDEILSFSRLESGREELVLREVRVPELLADVEALIEPTASRKGLELRVRIPDDLPPLRTDVAKMRQILVNLLDNAVKFTPEGSVTVEAAREDGSVRFSVIDTGIGIHEEDREKIFEPFRQLEQSSIREQGGTGLGLTVAHRLATLLGGAMRLESEPGRGSAFHVVIPQARADAV